MYLRGAHGQHAHTLVAVGCIRAAGQLSTGSTPTLCAPFWWTPNSVMESLVRLTVKWYSCRTGPVVRERAVVITSDVPGRCLCRLCLEVKDVLLWRKVVSAAQQTVLLIVSSLTLATGLVAQPRVGLATSLTEGVLCSRRMVAKAVLR